MSEWKERLQPVLLEGMAIAAIQPGRYGGRYVAEVYRMVRGRGFVPFAPAKFAVLFDDDPDLFCGDQSVDIVAHCMPNKCHGVGRARQYINENGTVTG